MPAFIATNHSDSPPDNATNHSDSLMGQINCSDSPEGPTKHSGSLINEPSHSDSPEDWPEVSVTVSAT